MLLSVATGLFCAQTSTLSIRETLPNQFHSAGEIMAKDTRYNHDISGKTVNIFEHITTFQLILQYACM